MNRRSLSIVLFILLAGFVLARVLFHLETVEQQENSEEEPKSFVTFRLPALNDSDYDWIGSRIYKNEALGKPEYLTHWNEGEDFPSLGIGHFIWRPGFIRPGLLPRLLSSVGVHWICHPRKKRY